MIRWPQYPTPDMLDGLVERFQQESAGQLKYRDLCDFDPPIRCTPRLANRLRAAGVASLREAAELKTQHWLWERGFGARCLAELATLLREHGLRFADEGE